MTGRWIPAATAVGIVLAAAVAFPARADRTTTAVTAKESWYLTAASAAPATAPATQDVSPYPAGTLHVGVTAGQEDSRSYLSLDLSSLDPAAVFGGTLVLPIAPDAGNRGVESAHLRVCRSAAVEAEVRGSTGPPPAAECTIGSTAHLRAAGDAFEVDLAPLAGFLGDGLALVPVIDATEAAWHVALHAHDSDAASAKPITARLSVREEAVAITPAAPALESTAFAATAHPETAIAFAAPDVGLVAAAMPVAPQAAPRTGAPSGDALVASPAGARVGAVGDGRFRYSIVFVLPLVLLLAVPYFGYALSAPIEPTDPWRQAGQRRRARRELNSN